jgi:maltokinase
MSDYYRNPQMPVKLDIGARWFGGKGRTVTAVREAGSAGGLSLVDVDYHDGGTERYLTFGAGLRWAPLLSRLRESTLPGDGGALELRPGFALDGMLRSGGPEREPSTDQTNSLVVIAERLLVKAYRRLEAGIHPEVELLTALDGSDAPVPAFAGSVHWRADDGTETAIALLQGFVSGSDTGWEAPIARAAEALGARHPFDVTEWHAAGATAAQLHAALGRAFPPRRASPAEVAGWQADALGALADAVAVEPGLSARAPEIARRLTAVTAARAPQSARIHGDLHVAQLLRTPEAILVVDFEGDPTRRLADRRRPDTPMRDLASLLRAADHVGSAAARRAGGPAPDDWIATATEAILDGYASGAPAVLDLALVAALELAKECGELVYAHSVLPEWLYAPRLGLARLLERP